jgi:hypothetical protein
VGKRIWRESQHPRDGRGRFAKRGGAAWIKRAAAELTAAPDASATRSASGRPQISRSAKAGVVLQAHADGGRPSAVRAPKATVTPRATPAALASFLGPDRPATLPKKRTPRPSPGAAALLAARSEEQAPQVPAMVAARTAPDAAPVPGAADYASMRQHTLVSLARQAGVPHRNRSRTEIAADLAAKDAQVKADRKAKLNPSAVGGKTDDAGSNAAFQRAHKAILNLNLDRTAQAGDTPRPGELARLNEGTLQNMARSAPGSPLSTAAQAELDRRNPPVDTPRDNRNDGGMTSTTPEAPKVAPGADTEHLKRPKAKKGDLVVVERKTSSNSLVEGRREGVDIIVGVVTSTNRDGIVTGYSTYADGTFPKKVDPARERTLKLEAERVDVQAAMEAAAANPWPQNPGKTGKPFGSLEEARAAIAPHLGDQVAKRDAGRKAREAARRIEHAAEMEAKRAALRAATPAGVRPADGRPSIGSVTGRTTNPREKWNLGNTPGTAGSAPNMVISPVGHIDNRESNARIMNPLTPDGPYRYEIRDENTGEIIESGEDRDLDKVYAKANRIMSRTQGGGMARTAGKSTRFEARTTERKKDPSRGDFGKGPFYEYTVVEIDQDGNETVRVKTSSAAKAEANAAEMNAKEQAANPRTPTTNRKQIPRDTKVRALSPKLSSEQKANYDAMLGDGPNGVIHKQSRQIVEQLEAHGWSLVGNESTVGLLKFRSPDGREISAQFLVGQYNSKPRFFTGSAQRGTDLTYKAALAHVVTPTLEEVGGPNIREAAKRIGLDVPYLSDVGGRNDPTLRPIQDAQQGMHQKGSYGGRGESAETAAASLRAAAVRNRETAKRADELYGYGGARDQRSELLEQRADQFEKIADELDKMTQERAAYEAERDRRAALPPDIRPGRSAKAAPAKKAAPATAPSGMVLQTFADRMRGEFSDAERLEMSLKNEEERQKLRAREAERAQQLAEARANDTRPERERLAEQLQQDRAADSVDMSSGRRNPQRVARMKQIEARIEEIDTAERKAQIKGYRKGDKVKTTYGGEVIEVEVVGKTSDGYLRVLLPNGKRGSLHPKYIEGAAPAPKADAAQVAAPAPAATPKWVVRPWRGDPKVFELVKINPDGTEESQSRSTKRLTLENQARDFQASEDRKANPPAAIPARTEAPAAPAAKAEPDREALMERYRRAADRVARLDDDDIDSRTSKAAYQELREARAALAAAGPVPSLSGVDTGTPGSRVDTSRVKSQNGGMTNASSTVSDVQSGDVISYPGHDAAGSPATNYMRVTRVSGTIAMGEVLRADGTSRNKSKGVDLAGLPVDIQREGTSTTEATMRGSNGYTDTISTDRKERLGDKAFTDHVETLTIAVDTGPEANALGFTYSDGPLQVGDEVMVDTFGKLRRGIVTGTTRGGVNGGNTRIAYMTPSSAGVQETTRSTERVLRLTDPSKRPAPNRAALLPKLAPEPTATRRGRSEEQKQADKEAQRVRDAEYRIRETRRYIQDAEEHVADVYNIGGDRDPFNRLPNSDQGISNVARMLGVPVPRLTKDRAGLRRAVADAIIARVKEQAARLGAATSSAEVQDILDDMGRSRLWDLMRKLGLEVDHNEKEPEIRRRVAEALDGRGKA